MSLASSTLGVVDASDVMALIMRTFSCVKNELSGKRLFLIYLCTYLVSSMTPARSTCLTRWRRRLGEFCWSWITAV